MALTTYTFTITGDLSAAALTESDYGKITINDGGGAKTLTQLKAANDSSVTVSNGVITVAGYGKLNLTPLTFTKLSFVADSAAPAGIYNFTNNGTIAQGQWEVVNATAMTGGFTLDTVTANATMTTLKTGSGADSVDNTGYTLLKSINTGAGKDTIVNAIAGTTIDAGDDNDDITIKANATVTGGAGDDKITVNTGAAVTVTGGAGADTFVQVAAGDKLQVEDYRYSEKDVVKTKAVGTLGNSGTFSNADVTVKVVDPTDSVYKVKDFVDGAATATEYWTSAVAANVTMDGSQVTNAMVIDASSATNAVVQGGSGNDTITVASTNATITAGKGLGNDNITGFGTGFTGDVLNLSGQAIKDIIVTGDGAHTTIAGSVNTILTGVATTANGSVNLVLKENGGASKKVAAVSGTGIITSTTADADIYLGSTAGGSVKTVDFSGYDKDGFVVNLADSAKYVNITTVVGAKTGGTYVGSSTSADKFDLSKATKAVSVWGGAGKSNNDIITLATAATGADVTDVVSFGKADGTDTINNFKTGFNATKSDVLYLYDVADVTSLKVASGTTGSGKDVSITAGADGIAVLAAASSADSLNVQVKDSAGKTKKLALGVFAGSSTSIDGVDADMVIGQTETTAAFNTVTYATSTSNLAVNLQDASVYKNIHHVNLTGATGAYNVVVGSADTVTGSTIVLAGTATEVWGGSKADDAITAGTGKDTIWFGAGDGKDAVTGFSAADDKVKFYDKSVSEIASAYTYDATAAKFTVKADDKNTLTLGGLTLNASNAMNLVDKDNVAVKAVVGGNALTYNKDAKVYMGTGATLAVNSATEVGLYLGNGVDAKVNDIYFSGVTAIDASGSAGNTILIGSKSTNNILTAGNVSSAMWGGGISQDTMNGNNSGVDQFWFGNGDGLDTANTVDKGDKVVLYNVTSISDVTMSTATANQDIISLKDGSVLTINDTANAALTGGLTFQLGADSSAKSYTYDKTNKVFVAK